MRAPAFTLATVGTLSVGLGAFAVVWSAVDNVLLEPPAYEQPYDLYFVWRDYRAFFDLDRGRGRRPPRRRPRLRAAGSEPTNEG